MTDDDLNPFASPQTVNTSSSTPSAEVERSADPAAMARVRLGLSMAYYAICGLLLCVLSHLLLVVAAGAYNTVWPLSVIGWIGLVMFGLNLLYLAGVGCCLNAPRASRARPFAAASLACQLLGLVTNLSDYVWARVLDPNNMQDVVLVTSIATYLLMVAAGACFLICMWRLADYVANPFVCGRAKRALATGSIAGVLFLFGGVLSFSRSASGGVVIGVGAIVFFVAGIMYANTMAYLRKAIVEGINPSPPAAAALFRGA